MILKSIYIGLILLGVSIACLSQVDSVIVDKNHKFEDGLYIDFADFKAAKPQASWDQLEGSLFTNPITKVTYIDSLANKNGDIIDINKVWGISLGGIPYININEKTPAGLHLFVGLKVRGSLCYMSYETKETQEETMKAYNPLTGIPFRSAKIKKEVIVEKEYLLDFDSGLILPFNKDNLLSLIEIDKALTKSVIELSSQNKEKLFKCLLIFCDRNPVKIPLKE